MKVSTLATMTTATLLAVVAAAPVGAVDQRKPPRFTAMVRTITAAGMSEILNGVGSFTLFAPTDTAFAKLPVDTLQALGKLEHRSGLKQLVNYHVVPGEWDSERITRLVREGNGRAELITLAGARLLATLRGHQLVLTDQRGRRSKVTTADLRQSNGIVHVVDQVLWPH